MHRVFHHPPFPKHVHVEAEKGPYGLPIRLLAVQCDANHGNPGGPGAGTFLQELSDRFGRIFWGNFGTLPGVVHFTNNRPINQVLSILFHLRFGPSILKSTSSLGADRSGSRTKMLVGSCWIWCQGRSLLDVLHTDRCGACAGHVLGLFARCLSASAGP